MNQIDMLTPLTPIVGGRAAKGLAEQLDLHTVGDLVRNYPRKYLDRGKLTDIAGLEVGEQVTLIAEVKSVELRNMRHRRGSLLAVVVTDDLPLAAQLRPGDGLRFRPAQQ